MDRKTGLMVIGIGVLLVLGAASIGMINTGHPASGDTATGSKGLLYRVDGGGDTAYLFGSIHFGSDSLYPVHDQVVTAFQRSDVLVLEIDMANRSRNATDRQMREQGTYDDQRMTDVVSNATFATIHRTLQAQGYNRTAVNRMKPWYAATQISDATIHRAGYDPSRGNGRYFADQASARNMTVTGLESVAAQAAAFNTLSNGTGASYALNAVTGYRTDGTAMQQLARNWQTGNTDAFARQRQILRESPQTQSMHPFYRALFDRRDRRMADSIDRLLTNDTNTTYFIVVGALHLVGENSITDNLADDGYTVTDVYGEGR